MTHILELEERQRRLRARKVLHGIDLSVEEGHVAVVLGANGAGKTTTLRAICSVRREGRDPLRRQVALVGKSPEEVSRLGIAHVPQGRGTFSELTVDDNMRIGAINRKDKNASDLGRWYTASPAWKRRKRRPAA